MRKSGHNAMQICALGYWIVAIQRRGVGQIYQQWPFTGILGRVASEERRALVDAGRDKVVRVRRQRREQLVGGRQEVLNSACTRQQRGPTVGKL